MMRRFRPRGAPWPCFLVPALLFSACGDSTKPQVGGYAYPPVDPGPWQQVSPVPTGFDLLGLAAIGNSRLVLLGEDDKIFVSDDAGDTWIQTRRGLQTFSNRSVFAASFPTPLVGTVVGGGKLVLRTRDGGATWTEQTPNLPDYRSTLYAVSFVDENHGMAVGDLGEVRATSDGGVTWTPANIGSQTPGEIQQLTGIQLLTPSRAVVTGVYGVLQLTTDGGSTWRDVSGELEESLFEVLFWDETHGVALGAGFVLTSADGGETWTRREVPSPQALFGVARTPNGRLYAAGIQGTIVSSENDGASWRVLDQGTLAGNDRFWGIATVGNTVVAAGTDGKVRRSTDGGGTWKWIHRGATENLHGVVMLDRQVAVAVGDGGIFRTHDGGLRWEEIVVPGGGGFAAVDFADYFRGVAVGPELSIRLTADRGLTWTPVGTQVPYQHLLDVAYLDNGTIVATGNIGQILRSTDDGETWSEVQPEGSTDALAAVDFLDDLGFAAGLNGVILRTLDGGASWTEVLSPGTTDSTTGHFRDVAVLDESHAVVVGYRGGSGGALRLLTFDGGATWTWGKLFGSRAGEMEALCFLDARRGFAAGADGAILFSEDGGATWTDLPNRSAERLWGISAVDADHVVAVGLWGTILRTTTGGR